MHPHQQRVVAEKMDLDEKLVKLVAFAKTDIYSGLSEAERKRMDRQARAMTAYSIVLGERIASFE